MTSFSAARALLTILLTGGLMGCSTTGSADTPAAPSSASPADSAVSASPAPPADSTASASPAPGTTATASGTSAAGASPDVFPLVVSRTGGFAGVQDRVSIQADGSAVVTRRGQTPVRTSVPASETADLRRILAAPDAAPASAPSGAAPCADGFHYEISSPALKAVIDDCGDAHGAAVTAVLRTATRLLNG